MKKILIAMICAVVVITASSDQMNILTVAKAETQSWLDKKTIKEEVGYVDEKIVYHINLPELYEQKRALKRIMNHHAFLRGIKSETVIVLEGFGLSLLKHSREEKDLDRGINYLRKIGVRLIVGESDMKQHDIMIGRDFDPLPAEDIVPNAMQELIRLQRQGYIYIRP